MSTPLNCIRRATALSLLGRFQGYDVIAISPDQLGKRWQEPFKEAMDEFEAVALYSADFAASMINLGALASYLGKIEQAPDNPIGRQLFDLINTKEQE